ncbi:MAG: ABC-type lipoprotein release transport system permease subunit [Candidatus Paceibacteria bacterium]|jgi:ABC-type lipoprotein release transport system permease subunit
MRALKIGFLLGFRQVQRSNKWTTTLIIFVMMLTFLNLIAVSGILVGLIEGSERAVQRNSLGDVVITELAEEDYILETSSVVNLIKTFPEIEHYSVRYKGSGQLEANYKERRDLSAERDIVANIVTGIDPVKEDAMTNLSSALVEGEFLDPNEEGYILIGAYFIKRYAEQFGDVFESLENVYPGDSVRLTSGNVTKEFIVKGIISSKVDEVNLNSYIPEREFRRIFNRLDRNADQIVLRLNEDVSGDDMKQLLLAAGIGDYAKVQTFQESLPKFLIDIKDTFNLLGTMIGSIGLVVASITIFIIIFINAISRRQQIGILKGIGIDRKAIEVAYVLQAAFYALTGSALGALLTYGFLIGYFDANPINFPFSDGILVAEPIRTFYRFITLFIITLFAGFIPAWVIVRQNTLNSILGRK